MKHFARTLTILAIFYGIGSSFSTLRAMHFIGPTDSLLQHYTEGKKLYKNKDYVASISPFQKALDIAVQLEDFNYQYKIRRKLSSAFRASQNMTEAINNLQGILKLPQDVLTEKKLSSVHADLADSYSRITLYEKAFEHGHKALILSEKLGNKKNILKSTYILGYLHYYQKEYAQALEYYLKVLKLNPESDAVHIRSLISIASCYEELEQFETATYYNELAIDKINAHQGIGEGYALQNMGTTQLKQQNYALAQQYLEQALVSFEEANNIHGKITVYKFLAKVHLKTGAPQTAIRMLNEAIRICRKADDKEQLAETLLLLAEAQEKTGNLKASLKLMQEYTALSDSLFNKEQIEQISMMKFSAEVERKNQEIDLLNKQMQIAQMDKELADTYAIIYLVSCAVLTLFLAWFFHSYFSKKRLHDELLKKNDFIYQQNKELESLNEELKQFTFVASHDLKSPMRSIKSYSTLLRKKHEAELSDRAKKYLENIEKSVSRMNHMLDETLLLSNRRPQAQIAPSAIDIHEVLEDCKSNLHNEIQENKAWIDVPHTGFPLIMGHKSQLIQVFQNLIGNAIKFRSDERPVVQIRGKFTANMYEFSITDNGIGIPKNQQEKVFQMFERGENADHKEGTGIGLATCKKIIEKAGGTIGLKSDNAGTTFYFTLPLFEMAAISAQSAS
ncbi:MAG: ATP-binding protein [Saprospiraceae bacterium]|nr:ATP-binding protein [Saprospiraceae bacterium]